MHDPFGILYYGMIKPLPNMLGKVSSLEDYVI